MDSHNEKKDHFPREFRRLIQACGMPLKSIADQLGIPQKRFYGIVEGTCGVRMDNKEFILIRDFCTKIEEQHGTVLHAGDKE